MSRRFAGAAAVLASLVFAAPSIAAVEPQASLPDIEDEVMCTICGTTLGLSESPQAERQKVFIRDLIAAGQSKEQIKLALVDEYGPEVLAVPSDQGFDLTAWIVPIAGIGLAIVAIGISARRWRAARRAAPAAAPRSELDPEDEERLRTDLSRYGL